MTDLKEPTRMAAAEPESTTPWVETREGMLFFLHAVLVSPQFVVLFPLALILVLEPIGAPRSLLETLATIPILAGFALPFTGWLFAVPAWFALKARRETAPPLARHALMVFAVLHLGFVAYAAWFWLTGQAWPTT